MIHYIIESTVKWNKKDGTPVESKHYFQKHTGYPLPLNHMTGNKDEAAKYDCKSEAKRIITRYFGNREKYKILKIESNDND